MLAPISLILVAALGVLMPGSAASAQTLAAGPSRHAAHPAAGQAAFSVPTLSIPAQAPTTQTAAAPRDDDRRTLGRFPANLIRGAVGVFSTDNIQSVAIGGGIATAALVADADIAEAIADPDRDFGVSFEDGAQPALTGLGVAAVFVAGRVTGSPRFRAMSYDLIDAFLLNWAYTHAMKTVTRRERPNGEDSRSLPSGHASNAFTLAAVADHHYGWKAGVPAYAMATAVALSRIQRNKHHLSDVIAGAALGYVVGRTAVRVNGGPLGEQAGTRLSVVPVVNRRTQGVLLVLSY